MTEAELTAFKERVYELNRMSAAIQNERAMLEEKIAHAIAKHSVGDRVMRYGKGPFEITRICRGYGENGVRYFGRKVLKAGTLGLQELELYGRLEPANVRVNLPP